MNPLIPIIAKEVVTQMATRVIFSFFEPDDEDPKETKKRKRKKKKSKIKRR